jgi:5-methylcytosine-specific restriction endonuclease McrA
MPPAAVKTVRDLIYWQYAKIISNSAGEGKENYGFIMNRFKELKSGNIEWSSAIREYVKERQMEGSCVYCGSRGQLTLEHILPRARRGPDAADNAMWICRSCNSSKGAKRLYEWYGLEERNDIPRVAEGKYLKLLYALHEEKGTLDSTPRSLCPRCDLGERCPVPGKLSVYCLEGTFAKV